MTDEISGGDMTAELTAGISDIGAARAARAARHLPARPVPRVAPASDSEQPSPLASWMRDRFWRNYYRAEQRKWAGITNPALRDMRQYLAGEIHYGNLDPDDWTDPETTPDVAVLREIRRNYAGDDGQGLDRWRRDHPDLEADLTAALDGTTR